MLLGVLLGALLGALLGVLLGALLGALLGVLLGASVGGSVGWTQRQLLFATQFWLSHATYSHAEIVVAPGNAAAVGTVAVVAVNMLVDVESSFGLPHVRGTVTPLSRIQSAVVDELNSLFP